MLPKGVLVLALVALACQVQADCIKSFSEIGQKGIMQILNKVPGDWSSMSYNCDNRNIGWTLLKSVDILSAADKKLCGGGLVPFGLTKSSGKYYWANGDEIKIDDTFHFERSKDVKLEDYQTGYGVLDLATGAIHFTDYDKLFSCALCQAKELTSVHDFNNFAIDLEGDEWEMRSSKFYRITVVGNEKQTSVHKLSKESQSTFEKLIVSKLGNASMEEIIYENSILNSNGFFEMHFNCRVNGTRDYYDYYNNDIDITKFQNVPLDSQHSMSVEDVTECPKSVAGAGVFIMRHDSNRIGSKLTKLDINAWQISQTTCTLDDKVGRPVWRKPTVFKVNHEPCSDLDQYANNLEYASLLGPEIEYNQRHQLHKYFVVDINSFNEVARLTSREIRVTGELKTEMHDDLQQILVALQTHGKVVTAQEPRVYFVVADIPVKTHAVNGFTMTFLETGVGEVVEPIQVGLNKKALPNQAEPAPTVSLTVSNELIDNSDRIAFATFFKPKDSYDKESLQRVLEVDVVVVGDRVGQAIADSYVDMYYDISHTKNASNVSCRATSGESWMSYSNYGSADEDYKGCKHLESSSKTQILCRCDTKFFTAKVGAYSGTFQFKEINKSQYRSYQSMSNYRDSYDENESSYEY